MARKRDVVRVSKWEPVEQDYWGNDPLQDGIAASRKVKHQAGAEDSGVSDNLWNKLRRKAAGEGNG